MGIVFKNNAKTTLASSLSNSATSASVADGSVFPTLGAGEFFLITFDDGTNNEICKCTARSSNTLTIVRAQDNTSARAFSSGDAAEGRVTAGVLETIQENIAAKSANQTVYNATTASSATAYDIGIDPGVEANAMVFLDGVMQHHDTFSFSGSTLTFDAAPTDGTKLEVIVDNLINLQSSNLTVDSFTAADVGGSAQTAFTLSDTPAAETNLIVFVDGVFQDQDAYTISSSTLTITTGVIAGRGVTVYVINPVNIGTPSDSTITSAKLSGNITMPGTLTVGANDVAFDSPTFVVDNSNSRVGLGTASPTVPVDIVGETKMSSHLTLGTTSKVQFGDSGTYIHQSADGVLDLVSDNEIEINATTVDVNGALDVSGNITGTLATAAQTNITSLGTLTALTVDEITINADTITATDDFILDVEGEIVLDANNGGQVQLKDNGTEYGRFFQDSNRLFIQSMVGDADILIRGVDGSSTFTALSFDMSAAGAATFNSQIGVGAAPLQDAKLDLHTAGSTAKPLAIRITNAASTNYAWEIWRDNTTGHLNFGEELNGTDTTNVTWNSTTAEQTNAGSQPALFLQDTTAGGGAGNGGQVIFKGHHAGSGDGFREFAKVLGIKTNATGGDTHGELRFYVNKGTASAAEAGRFNHDGQLQLCGQSSSHLSPSFANAILFTSNGTSGDPHVENKVSHTNTFGLYKFQNGNGTAGSISMYASSVSYNTSSDYRLKENVNYTWDATTKLKELKPCEFEFKADTDNVVHQGFLAHEVDNIVPTSVHGDKDGEQIQQLDHSKLVPLLVKTIQELEARIKTLEDA